MNVQVRVKSAGTKLDYETRTTYMVTVTATDSFGESASIDVTIMVTDVDEAPEIMRGRPGDIGHARMDYAENGQAGGNLHGVRAGRGHGYVVAWWRRRRALQHHRTVCSPS